jgi:tRNA(Ile)-lysidine synthase
MHIHHGLHPDASQWAERCLRVCASLAVPCLVKRVNVGIRPGESLEAAAREARYAAFRAHLTEGETLLLAQHADDQAETLLLQLLRGAGVAGLAAMPARAPLGRGWLLRPWLDFSREALRGYARQAGLAWIEDPANGDQRFDRNFLRHTVIPLLKQRWPGLRRTLSRAAAHQAQAGALLGQLARQDWAACAAPPPPILAASALRPLSVAALLALEPARGDNLLRFWIAAHGLRPPSTARLACARAEIAAAGADRQPCLAWTGGEIRRYRDTLWALPPLPPPPDHAIPWDIRIGLRLPVGWLRAKPGGQFKPPSDQPLNVRFRLGGETCALRGHRRDVKKILQEAEVPAWLRPFTPLIYAGENLAAVAGAAICDGYAARPGEAGWTLEFSADFGSGGEVFKETLDAVHP